MMPRLAQRGVDVTQRKCQRCGRHVGHWLGLRGEAKPANHKNPKTMKWCKPLAGDGEAKLYTEAQVRDAYWAVFHESGEQWFNYLDSPEANAASTEAGWQAFLDVLVRCP